MKPVEFLGDSLERLRKFPEAARKEAGVQLHKVQLGLEPSDWKSVKTVGPGVREIRVRDDAGAFRVLYVTHASHTIYLLHAFQKKSRQTPKRCRDQPAEIDCWRTQMKRQKFDTVWEALERTPAEAANMTMRSRLLIAIEQQVRSWGVTQAVAARRLGITQPRLNDLLRGKIVNFSVDTLLDLAAKAGLSVQIHIDKAA